MGIGRGYHGIVGAILGIDMGLQITKRQWAAIAKIPSECDIAAGRECGEHRANPQCIGGAIVSCNPSDGSIDDIDADRCCSSEPIGIANREQKS